MWYGEQGQVQGDGQGHADRQRAFGVTDVAVAEAVDQVEEGVVVAERLEWLGQPLDAVEGAAEEGQRHDHEICHARQVIELFSPKAGDHAHRA